MRASTWLKQQNKTEMSASFTSAERPSKCLRPLHEPIGTAVQQDQSMRFGRAAWKRAGSMGNWFSVLYLQKCQLSSKSHSVEEWVCIVCSSQKASGEARGDRWQNRKERKPYTRAIDKRLKTQHSGLSPFLLLRLVFTFVYVAEFLVLTSTVTSSVGEQLTKLNHISQ